MVSCGLPEGTLDERVRAFLSDRSAEAVLGIRRAGREATVKAVCDTAETLGLSVCVYPRRYTGQAIMMFPDWKGCGDIMDTFSKVHPDVDVMFGQDLCHQVPAVVRLEPSKAFSTR